MTREEPIDNKKIADHTKEELEVLFWETWDEMIRLSVFLEDAHDLLSAAGPFVQAKCIGEGYESRRSRTLLRAITNFRLLATHNNCREKGRTAENIRTFEERGIK